MAGSEGVIDVSTLSVIRRWALREQLSIREIARRTGLSRNTIKKYLRADAAEAAAAQLVPLVLRAHPGIAREGACAGRPAQGIDQAPHAQTVLADEAWPLGAFLPPHRADPPPRSNAAGGVGAR